MGGQGAYFTTFPPYKQIGSALWPSMQFRENLLKANYGDDWANPDRQQSADAVIVCFVDRDVCVEVRLWLRGRLCPERYRCPQRISICQARADAVARRLNRRCQGETRRESCAPTIFTMAQCLWSTAQSSCTKLN